MRTGGLLVGGSCGATYSGSALFLLNIPCRRERNVGRSSAATMVVSLGRNIARIGPEDEELVPAIGEIEVVLG